MGSADRIAPSAANARRSAGECLRPVASVHGLPSLPAPRRRTAADSVGRILERPVVSPWHGRPRPCTVLRRLTETLPGALQRRSASSDNSSVASVGFLRGAESASFSLVLGPTQ